MLSESQDRLFGGINSIIAEKFAKMKEGTSVSDTDQKALGDKEQLDEIGCKKQMEESQDYHTFMKKEDWDSRVNHLHLSPAQNGKDHVEVKDQEGKVQGWWNGHTGVGYLHKDCCDSVLHETNNPANLEEEAFQPEKRKFDVSYKTADGEMRVDTHEKFSPAILFRNYKDMEAEKGIKLVDITHDGKSVMGEASRPKLEISDPDPIHESHMTPELQKKQEEYVMKLKKNADSFKDKYGEDWESVMYATATKLAKNDLGIKEETIGESEVDPLKKNSIGDSIVSDQPIKN